MRLSTLLVFVCVVGTSLCQRLEQETCDAKRMMVDHNVNNADVILGGLFEMRTGGNDGYGCGSPHPEIMLAYEAARWAINKINTDNYVTGIRMGIRAYDTCYSRYQSVAAANNFYPQFTSSSMYCNQTNKYNLGILGSYTSWTSKPVAALTGLSPASMISPVASSPELSDKTLYPYFLRTGLSASEQIRAMMAAMKAMSWKRILLVYSDNDYGGDAMREMVRMSATGDVCIVETLAVPGVPNLSVYRQRLQNAGTYDVNGAVYFGDHFTSMMVLEAIDQIVDAQNIQWMFSSINMNEQIFPKRIRGAIYVQPSFTEVTEFFDYFTNNINENSPPVENPWYQDWFMQTFQCRLQGINYAPYSSYSDCSAKTATQKRAAVNTRYSFVDSTIKAVYAYAKALKSAHAQICGGVSGMCQGLRQMSTQQFHIYLKGVNLDLNEVNINSLRGQFVKFDNNGDFYTAGHDFWNYNNRSTGSYSFKKVGSFTNNILSVDLAQVLMYSNDRNSVLATLPQSLCPAAGCRNCVVPRPMVQFTYSPGDVILGGLFDLHAQGSEVLLCGALKPIHALNAAAFRYAIRRVKQNFPGILNGIDLGSLIVDLCDNAETGRLLLNNLLGGRHVVGSVDPNLIKTVVGELDSTEAVSMAAMLGQFSMPYIESSATSVYLSEKELFPTFTRAVPSDFNQMLAIVLLLKRMNWNYVQVVYTADPYGESGYNMIKAEGAKRSVCVAASHQIGRDGSHATIVHNLMQKPDARVVVAVVDSSDYRVMLQAIKDQGLQGKFVLIGTETWGRRGSVVSGFENVAEGSITLEINSPQVTEFRQWLGTLNPTNMATMKEMPFFAEWYQYAYNCYLDAKNRGMYPAECTASNSITQAPRYEESPYTPFMIYATYAAARAIDQTVRDFCGDANRNYQGICSQFRSSADVPTRILEYLKKTEFSLNGYNLLMKMGEGQSNYEFYSYTSQQYTRIGTYNTNATEVQLDFASPLSLPTGFRSQCAGRCSECVYLIQTNPFSFINEDAKLLLGGNFALHMPGTDPFLCGALRLTNGIQSFLAVSHALNQVNMGQAPVSVNVKVGALLMDHCNSEARAYGLPSALYSGILGQMEPRPNLNAIRAWLTDNTLATEGMQDFFNNFNLPVISPMATTNKFLNNEEYPTFLRTVQGDSTIANALAILVKSLGLQFVTVLHSDNSFGKEGMDTFTDIARQEGVCIIKTVKMGSDAIDNITRDLVTQPTHVVVTYLGQADMDTFLEARGRIAEAAKLVIISPEPYPLVFYRKGLAAQNLLSLRMRTNTLDKFRQYILSLTPGIMSGDHPMLRQYYMELFQCNLPGEYKYSTNCGSSPLTNSPIFFVDNYVLSTINAVYTFVAAAHETLIIQCGSNYTTVCAKFYSDPNTNTILLGKMREVSFVDPSGATFSFIGKEGNTGREIIMFNGTDIKKVADFAGASINILDREFNAKFEQTRSSCNSPCTECINNNMNFTYIPGDLMLGGIFDVHKSAITPFSCGGINTLRGFQLLEAFHFAINKVNDKTGPFANVLKNVRLGGIGLDSCQSAVKGGYIVSNIHSGLTVLRKDGHNINPETIESYIGTYSSGRSIYLARLLKSLKIPQISFGSTSVSLLDQDRYPYFLRTVPADDKQAMGMIQFLRKFDIRYVQVVHTANNYGEQGAAVFAKLAAQEKVCVAQTISFLPQSEVTVESANDVVLALLKKPVANTVVIFADTAEINELLRAIRRNPDARGKFKFVGSDTWANNPEAVSGVQDLAVGAVTVDLDVVDIQEFDEYLSTKTPANYPENPWFPEYYEEIQNCYLTIPTTKYAGRCTATPKNIITSKLYKQDTALIHVINAVYSAAYGLDMALRDVCGSNYTTVCEAYKNRDMRRDFVLQKIKQASFTDLSNQPFSFSSRGDGNKGYVMYSLETAANEQGYTYSPVAKYTSTGELKMTSLNYAPSWDGSCERVDSCTECPTIRNLLTRFMLPPYLNSAKNPNPATLVYTTSIHSQGNDAYRCGAMNMEDMMGALSVLYTLEYSNLIANKPFDLRTLIIDNCNNPLRIDQDLLNLLNTGKLCNSNFDSAGSIINVNTIMGVLTQGSRFVVAANRVTMPLKIQLVSSSASSAALSDQWRYPYFARTVPPDNLQMEVIAKILKTNDWTYVSVLYTRESYGINGYKTLQKIFNEGLYSCIGAAESISPTATVEEIRPIVKKLAETEGISVLVLIVVDPRTVLEALKAEGLHNKFLVIGTDTWATLPSVLQDQAGDIIDLKPADFAGSITINFRNAHYNDFVTWMTGITYQDRKGIPDDWFEEFYQHIHECQLTSAQHPLMQYQKQCNGDQEKITEVKVLRYGPRLGTIAAAYAMGNGLSKLYRDHGCADVNFSTCMARIKNARERLFNYTLAQTWNIKAGQVNIGEQFDLELGYDDRFWNVGYNIYSMDANNNYYSIGSQTTNLGFVFNNSGNYLSPRASRVSQCPKGKLCGCAFDDSKVAAQVQAKYMGDHEPRNYFMYDEDTGEKVYTWPVWAITVAVLTCVGLLCGLILFFYFLIFYPIRGGTTALGFLMMLGLFGVYAINFAFFKPAAKDTCGVREFLQGVVYAVVIAPLFVKAVDNWRFKDSEYSPKRYVGLTHPVSLVLIALCIIAVQCIIPIEWLILRNPSASIMANSTNRHDWMWCDPHDFYDVSLILSMSYVVFLIILTSIFSALAWDSESNYYESRWIFVSCVCTAGCFLVWMVVSTNAGPPFRDPAVAIANFVNATAILIFIPFRKFVLLIQFSSEEEETKSMPVDEAQNELYSTVYNNQMYQTDVFQPDEKPGSEDGY